MTTSRPLLEVLLTKVMLEPGLYPTSGPWSPQALALAKAEFTKAQVDMVRKVHPQVMEVCRVVEKIGTIGVAV